MKTLQEQPEAPQATKTPQTTRVSVSVALSQWWMVIILLALIIVFALFAPGFLSQENFVSTTVFASSTLLLAVAETFVIITAGIDLSVGAILGLSGMVSAVAMQYMTAAHYGATPTIIVGLIVAMLTGMVIGAINGLVIAFMDITPFIATLGMLGIATGFTFLITNGVEITNIPLSIGNIGNASLLGWLPIPFGIAIIVGLIAHYALKSTRFGLQTYAIGSNAEGSRVSGVNVKRHLFYIYTLSGLISGLAGFLVVSRLIAGSPLEGANDELNAIAAVVIGGASLFGGTGTIFRTFVGGLVISVLVTGLVIAGVQPYWQTVAVGVTIILAVFIDQRQQKQEK